MVETRRAAQKRPMTTDSTASIANPNVAERYNLDDGVFAMFNWHDAVDETARAQRLATRKTVTHEVQRSDAQSQLGKKVTIQTLLRS